MDLDGLEKLTSNSLEFNNKSVEEALIEVGKFALFAIRIPGYLPLTTIRSHAGLQLERVRCSGATFYTILVTVFCLIGNAFFAHTFIDKFFLNPPAVNETAEDERYGNTEAFIWISLLILVCYTTYLRITRIFFTSESSLKYWKQTVALIESFVIQDYHLSSKRLQNISISCKKWTIFYILIAISRISYCTYNLYLHLSRITLPLDPADIKASCLDIFLALTLCFHVGFAIWLTFLIKILIFCYETIHDDLKHSHCSVRDKEFKGRRKTSARIAFHIREEDLKILPANATRAIVRSSGNSTVTTVELNGDTEIEEKIQNTISNYEAIEKQMHAFNVTFGNSILLETAFTFFLLIVNVYSGEVYIKLKWEELNFVVFTMGVPIVIFSSSICHFATECSVLSGKAVTILKKLEPFFVKTDKPELRALQLKMVGFIARVADNPPNITASHFFSINRHLLTSILGTVTTYLIVLMQFRQAGLHIQNGNSTLNTNCPEDRYWACHCTPNIEFILGQEINSTSSE